MMTDRMNEHTDNSVEDVKIQGIAPAANTRRIFLKGSVAAAAMTTIGSASLKAFAAAPFKTVVITGSPRKRGTSFVLADEFIKGAKEAGSSVYRFDSAFERVTPCNGCDHCGLGSGDCVYKDDMVRLNPYLEEADLVVLCTPLYYFGFSAQIKAVIDRFYAINSQLHVKKKCVLMATAWNSDEWTMHALQVHYETLCRYMYWEDVGQVMAIGCGTRSDVVNSQFPREAYELARKVCHN